MKKKITAISIIASMFLSSASFASTPFKDITDHWGKKEIEWGYSMGIVKGVSEKEFAPDDVITRAMFITLLYRLEGSPEVEGKSKFKDVVIDDYYFNAVNWAYENDITSGVSEDYFGSNSNITREDMVTLLFRKESKDNMEKSYKDSLAEYTSDFEDSDLISGYAKSAFNWAIDNDIISGYENNKLRPKFNTTRAQAMSVLFRYSELNKKFEPFVHELDNINRIMVKSNNTDLEIVMNDPEKIKDIVNKLNSFKITSVTNAEESEDILYSIVVETKDRFNPLVYNIIDKDTIEIDGYEYFTDSENYKLKNWDELLQSLFR